MEIASLDDAYIHLACAKHLAFAGVYGVTAHAFTAASSSVLWPLMLAALMKLAGPNVLLPLAVNVVAAVALVVLCDRTIRTLSPAVGPLVRAAALVAMVFAAPLPTLIVSGMEHTLHALVTVLFLAEAARTFGTGARLTRCPTITCRELCVTYDSSPSPR